MFPSQALFLLKIVITKDFGHEHFVVAGMAVYMCGYAFVSGTVVNFVVQLVPPSVSKSRSNISIVDRWHNGVI